VSSPAAMRYMLSRGGSMISPSRGPDHFGARGWVCPCDSPTHSPSIVELYESLAEVAGQLGAARSIIRLFMPAPALTPARLG